MAFSRPSLTELIERIRADIESRTDGSAFLRRSFEFVLVRVLAGLAHGLYGYLDWIAKQILPDTCDEPMLLRWGAIFDVTRKQPTKSSGSVRFPGVDGAVLALGTEMQSADGTRYVTTAAGTATGGFVVVAAQAVESGDAGNLDIGAELRLLAPVTGITSTGSVYGLALTGGTDLEDIEDYRERVLEEIKIQAQGGTGSDYERWVRSTAGVNVDKVWVQPRLYGPATVGVAFTVSESRVIPNVGERSLVQAVLDANVPVDLLQATAWIPTAHPLVVTAVITPTPTPEITAAIKAELMATVRRDAVPGGTVLISHIREAISAATGEEDHVLVSPVADVVPPSSGHLVVFAPDDGYGTLTLT